MNVERQSYCLDPSRKALSEDGPNPGTWDANEQIWDALPCIFKVADDRRNVYEIVLRLQPVLACRCKSKMTTCQLGNERAEVETELGVSQN